MLPSVSCNVDVGTNTSRALNTGQASNTGRGSHVIVLIKAGGFYSRKYGSISALTLLVGQQEGHPACKKWVENLTYQLQLERGPMPNVMAAQPNVGGALCQSSAIPFLVERRKLPLTPTARVPCSNTAIIGECKTSTQSEFCTWQNSVTGQEPPKMNI